MASAAASASTHSVYGRMEDTVVLHRHGPALFIAGDNQTLHLPLR